MGHELPGLILLIALALDATFAEAPNRLHPVAWMGSYFVWMRSRRYGTTPGAFRKGLLLLALGFLIVAGLSLAVARALTLLPTGLELLLTGLLLKPMFSLRALLDAAGEVRLALELEQSAKARDLLGWHLVSRNTEDLTDTEVAGAACESLAENLSDSFIAPIVYFALLGLPGAVLYRFVNVGDAVLGYRTIELEQFGKSTARLDDLLNLIPARLTAVLLLLALMLHRRDVAAAWHALLNYGPTTPSPNAGLTMATIAGGLGIRLTKRSVYDLNPRGRSPTPGDIGVTGRLTLTASLLGLLAIVGVTHA